MPSAENIFEAYFQGNEQAIEDIKARADRRDYDIRKSHIDSFLIKNTPVAKENPPAIELYDFLNESFGPDWWEWEIDTIFDLILDRFKVEPTPQTRDKVLAIRHLCESDISFSDWYEFNQLTLSFSGFIADFEILRTPTPGALVNAMMVLNYIRPDHEDGFGDDVKKYVSLVLINYGLYTPPPSIVQYVGRIMMEEFISGEMVTKWPKIYKMFENEDFEGETEEHIQAQRLYRVEKAANNYYYNDTTKDY